MSTYPAIFEPTTVSSTDRLIVALALVVALHLVLIFGIRFEAPDPPKRQQRPLNLTLAAKPVVKPPEKAKFRAEQNQLASGKTEQQPKASQVIEKPKPAVQPRQPHRVTEKPPEFTEERRHRPTVKPKVKPQKRVVKAPPKPVKARPVLTRKKSEKRLATVPKPQKKPQPKKPADSNSRRKPAKPAKLTAESLTQQIAQVTAAQNRSAEKLASRTKIRYINSVSAHKYKAAAYERAWQAKVVRVGNLNYPEAARRKNLSGKLLLSVGVKKDGSIYSIKVSRSSGSIILDEAAIRIVSLAAPFAPFPDGLREEADVLVITRSWIFSNDAYRMK